MSTTLTSTQRIRRATRKKDSRGFLYDCYPRWCTNKEAPQELKTCFFLQIIPQHPRLTQMDIGGASENVTQTAHDARHHICSCVHSGSLRET